LERNVEPATNDIVEDAVVGLHSTESRSVSGGPGFRRDHHHHVHHHGHAHHETEEEFGAVSGAKVEVHDFDSDEDIFGRFSEGDSVSGLGFLVRRLIRPRRLRQYFVGDVMHRERRTRKVGFDELFLDLIVVANIAVLGHELRETFTGWNELEKFFLLFQVVWVIWRDNLMFWNMFSHVRDVLEKLGVLFQVLFLCGIGVGAHDAFGTATRWVSLCAWMGEMVVNGAAFVFGATCSDPSLDAWYTGKNQPVLLSFSAVLTNSPFLVAAIIGPGHERTVRNLFWLTFGLNVIRTSVLPLLITRMFMKRRPDGVRIAVNIEALTEKFGLFTIIVLGESLLAILFEASSLILNGNRGRLYVGALLGVSITYNFFTLYFDVDQRILPGSVHAIRHNRYAGVSWAFLHIFLHANLIFAATGIGLVLRFASQSLDSEAHRASSEEAGTLPLSSEFTSSYRWLLCASTGAALLLLLGLGLLHKPAPYVRHRMARTLSRIAFGVLFILLPLVDSRISALGYLGTIGTLITGSVFCEFVLVEADHLRSHGWISGRRRESHGRDSEALERSPQ